MAEQVTCGCWQSCHAVGTELCPRAEGQAGALGLAERSLVGVVLLLMEIQTCPVVFLLPELSSWHLPSCPLRR